MNIGRSYRLSEFLLWTRRKLYVLVPLSALPVLLIQFAGWPAAAVPWVVVGVLGTAASFIVGFKNAQTYQRSMEAQQVWGAIMGTSRYWGLICRDFPNAREHARGLVLRHLAWLTALRYRLRTPQPWETARYAANAEYGKGFAVPETLTPLPDALRKYLAGEELERVLAAGSKATLLLSLQSEAIRTLFTQQQVVVLHHTEMQKTIKDLLELQGRAERIKNFPYPRQYAIVNAVFVWSFATVLPFGMAGEFARLGGGSAVVTFLAIPFSALVSWLYVALDQVGQSTENPFEGSANDVPIAHMSMQVESELRSMLGEMDFPAVPPAEKSIVL